MVYFDYNATAPLLPEARQAWLEAADQFPANPSSPHRPGARAEKALDDARQKLADLLDCDPLDLIFTSGATESNNLVLHQFSGGLADDAPLLISNIEHPSVLVPALQLSGKNFIPATPEGCADLNWIEEFLRRGRPALIGLMAANNETGVLQPWQAVQKICQEREIPFFCDAVQWIGKLPPAGLGHSTFLSGCAHKFGGPRGVGFLKCPGKFIPLISGGPQEDGRRAGTENLPGICGMVAALEKCFDLGGMEEIKKRLAIRDQFIARLKQQLPGTVVVGEKAERLWNTVLAILPAIEGQRWVVKVDKKGFAVSTGSACASGKEKPSHVLEAIGYSEEQSTRVLRFSSGWSTTAEDWNSLLQALAEIHQAAGGRV